MTALDGSTVLVAMGGDKNHVPLAVVPLFATVSGESNLSDLPTGVRLAMDDSYLYVRDSGDDWKRIELTALAG